MTTPTITAKRAKFPTILDVMTDEELLGREFAGDSWRNWRAFLAGLFDLTMTRSERNRYAEFTGGRKTVPKSLEEAWLLCGRRSGKSTVAALVAVFLACFRDYKPHLHTGEICTIMVLAADRRQARTVTRYISGLLHSVDLLESRIQKETLEG